MKPILRTWWLGLVLLVSSQACLDAQITVPGPPPLTSISIQTTGGITYLLHSATVDDCNWIQTEPVSGSDTNLSVTIAELRGEFCPLFCCRPAPNLSPMRRLQRPFLPFLVLA